jgi:hypothetical protein
MLLIKKQKVEKSFHKLKYIFFPPPWFFREVRKNFPVFFCSICETGAADSGFYSAGFDAKNE